jgi:hypothetical protein
MITFKGNTGCDIIQAIADRIEDAKHRDRRVLDADVSAIMREVARRAAQAAARATLNGELGEL